MPRTDMSTSQHIPVSLLGLLGVDWVICYTTTGTESYVSAGYV
jgi:hypothetical protein